jgi:hypothetical protein
LIGACVLLASRSAHSQATPTATVAVALEKKVITQHEPVLLCFRLTNSSGKEVDFGLGDGYEKVDIRVTDPDGRVRAKPGRFPPKENESLEFSEAIEAAPHTTTGTSVVLNDWFNFEKVGKYQINVAVPSSGTPPSASLQIPETSLTLTVFPRDEESLASACAALVARTGSESADERLAAAGALSRIDDPAAVPFLAQAMKRKSVADRMIAALARIGTPDALNVLVTASRSSDPEISSLASATLVALKKDKPSR